MIRIANLLAVIAVALFSSAAANARADHAPSIIPIVDTAQINGSPFMPAGNLINGMGFTGDSYDPSISFGDTQWRDHYAERNDDVQLLFDLGSVQEIGQMAVWNYYEGGAGTDGRSTKHFTLSYSSDNANYTSLGIQTLLQQPSPGYDASSLHTTIPLGVSAQYIKFSFSDDVGGNAVDVNYGDATWWGLNEVRFSSPVALLAGDYNDNGAVDAADYVAWRDNLGGSVVLPNDPIGGVIGPAQYDQWKANFGTGGGGGALAGAAVPEPTCALLFVAGLFCFFTGRRGR